MYKISSIPEQLKDKIVDVRLDTDITSIKLKGKEGIFREYCTGKRVNFCGRSVISPGPEYDETYIGLPISFKNNLQLEEDDIVVVNRQPSLARGSLLGLKVKFHNDLTIKINPRLCKIFNADFDGDEMNIFVPKTHKEEVSKLMKPNNEEYYKDFGTNIINDVQDYRLETYLSRKILPGEFSMDLNNFKQICELLVDSGAKGSKNNIIQMTEKVGVQMLEGKIAGVCNNSYLSGLTFDEFFLHVRSARQNIITMGIITPEFGYIQRRLSRGLEGISTNIDDAAKRLNSSHYIVNPLTQKALSSFHNVGDTIEFSIPMIKSILFLHETDIIVYCKQPHQYIYTILDDIIWYEIEIEKNYKVYFRNEEMYRRRITTLDIYFKFQEEVVDFDIYSVTFSSSMFGRDDYIQGIDGCYDATENYLITKKRILTTIRLKDQNASSSSLQETFAVDGKEKAYKLAFDQLYNIIRSSNENDKERDTKHIKNILEFMFIKENEIIPFSLSGFKKVMPALVYSIYESGDRINSEGFWRDSNFTFTEKLFLNI